MTTAAAGAAGAEAVTTTDPPRAAAELPSPPPALPLAGALASGDVAADPRPRVLFVEDERSITEPFSRALAREGFEPVVAHTVADALVRFAESEPDVVLLDISLPDGDGRDLCRELRGRSEVPIIMLTARGTETDRIVGLELGADDYVVKPFSGGEVIARLRALLRRARRPAATGAGDPPRPAAVTIGPLSVDPGPRRATLEGAELTLSRKEFDLLAELVAHAGTVVSREDLMSRVWDENWFGSTKTLDVHIRWLRQKLGDDPSASRFIHTVRGVGFRFTAPGEWAP
jgi:two-component system, OmpR family, response regulator RegX3